jgi:sugar O-acyltransferase (sialic acid O-acetyltransferase NeuD family)
MPKQLVILGTSGSAYDVLDILEGLNAQSTTWKLLGFLDDARPAGSQYLRFPVLGGLKDASRLSDCWFVNVIGSDASFRRRGEIVQSTGLKPDRFATLVPPQACVSPWAKLGHGVYVSFGASIGGGVIAGDHVSFSPACVIGHDSVFGDGALVAPRAVISGFVNVGRCCYIGAGAMIKQRIQIADGALVGLGAVVTRNVAAGATVVGNPARPYVRGSKT